MRLAGALTEGSGTVNEDGFGVSASGGDVSAAWVFDGVTGINGRNYLPAGSRCRLAGGPRPCASARSGGQGPRPPGNSGAAGGGSLWRTGKRFSPRSTCRPATDPPAACLILAKRYGSRWQALRLGNSCLLAEGHDGALMLACPAEGGFDQWLAREARVRRALGETDTKALLAEFRPQLKAARARRNQPGGYSVLECSEAALRMPDYLDLGAPARLLLCTDGYYRAVDHYGLFDAKGLVDASSGNVERVLADLRRTEAGDPQCLRLSSLQARRRRHRRDAFQPPRRPAMTRAFVLMLAALLPLAVSTAVRAEDITTQLADDKDDVGPTHTVSFWGECGDECYLASLSCEGDGGFAVELADVSGKDAAKAIAKDQTNAILEGAGKRIELPVGAFDYVEMNGSWDVTARASEREAAFRLIKDAKSFTLSVEGSKEKLPSTADVTAWLKACGQ